MASRGEPCYVISASIPGRIFKPFKAFGIGENSPICIHTAPGIHEKFIGGGRRVATVYSELCPLHYQFLIIAETPGRRLGGSKMLTATTANR